MIPWKWQYPDDWRKGIRLKDADCPPSDVSFVFKALRGDKVSHAEVLEELVDIGMSGALYVQMYKVPDEYPDPEATDNNIYLLEPEDAMVILGNWLRWKVIDEKGVERT